MLAGCGDNEEGQDIYLMFIGRDIEQKQIILNLPYSQCISLILCRDQLEDITG